MTFVEWLRVSTPKPAGEGVLVCVIDSGWRAERPVPGIHTGVNIIVGPDSQIVVSPGTEDLHGHGTSCATIIRALAPQCQIVPVQVFREGLRTSVPVLVRALEWAVQLRPDVINLSLAIDGGDTATIRRLCDRAVDAGIAVVAAARNGSGDGEPASYPSVIGVRAGSFRHCYHYGVLADQDIEFAGKGHWQVPGRRTCVSNSRAAAQMAGLIALLKSRHQDYKVAALRRMLIEYSMSTDAGSTTVH